MGRRSPDVRLQIRALGGRHGCSIPKGFEPLAGGKRSATTGLRVHSLAPRPPKRDVMAKWTSRSERYRWWRCAYHRLMAGTPSG